MPASSIVAGPTGQTVYMVAEHLRPNDHILDEWGFVANTVLRCGVSGIEESRWLVSCCYQVTLAVAANLGGSRVGRYGMTFPRTTLLRVRLGGGWDA